MAKMWQAVAGPRCGPAVAGPVAQGGGLPSCPFRGEEMLKFKVTLNMISLRAKSHLILPQVSRMDKSISLCVYLSFPNLHRWQERPPTVSHVTGKKGSSDIPVSFQGRGMPVGLPHTLTLIATIFFAAPCEYEGKQFSLGESWLSTNCLLCTCLHPIGVGCCET